MQIYEKIPKNQMNHCLFAQIPEKIGRRFGVHPSIGNHSFVKKISNLSGSILPDLRKSFPVAGKMPKMSNSCNSLYISG